MDLKNIKAAITLSAAVIVLYGLFFAPTQEQINNLNLLPLRRYITVEGEHDNFTIIEADEINKIIDLDINNKISSSNNQIDALYKREIQLL